MDARTYPRSISVVLALVILGAIFQTAKAQGDPVSFPDKPKSGTYYVDEAELISWADRHAINQMADILWEEKAVPIIAVTITSLADRNAVGYTIEQYAHELFNHWGIGNERHNYGMLLLVSVGDRKARIELGAAWGQSHNDRAKELMETLIIPQFRDEMYSQGIRIGVIGMDTLAREVTPPVHRLTLWDVVFLIAVIGLAIGIIASLIKHGRKGWGWAVVSLLGVVIVFFFKLVLFLTIFGGGDSDGGGASGDW